MKLFAKPPCGRRIGVLPFGILLTAFCSQHPAAANTATGGVTGSVADDTGRPVAGARVVISSAPSIKIPISAPPVITGPSAAMVTADSNGSFQASGLAPGQYIACAEAPVQGFLDPCHWSASAPTFTVGAGQTVAGVNIVTPKGSVLQFQVNDPLQLLQPAAGPIDLSFEIQVVTGKGFHYSAPIQSSTATLRSYAITVPFGTPLNLRVLASHFAVSDQSGNPVALAGTALNVATGSVPALMLFTVTGQK